MQGLGSAYLVQEPQVADFPRSLALNQLEVASGFWYFLGHTETWSLSSTMSRP